MPTTTATLRTVFSNAFSSRPSSPATWPRQLALLLPLLLLVAAPAWADYVDGEIFKVKQPDGEVVQVRVWGDEFHRVAETLEGYSVTRDPDSSEVCYAKLSDDAGRLISTGVRAGSGARDGLGLTKHLRIDPQVRDEIIRRGRERFAAEDIAFLTKASIEPGAMDVPSSGAVKGLLLLVDFSDDPATIAASEFDDFCNLPGYSGFGNNGSVNDYFLDVSDGNLDYTNYVTPQYYRAAQPKSYYNDDTVDFGPRARELVLEALTALEAGGYDFSQHDSNDDGLIDGINLFYAGGRPAVWATGIWPHSWTIEFYADGVASYKYQMTDIGDEITLRTFCHENGHMICYWPDLYDYDGDSSGVGRFCLMCWGTSNTNPGEPSAPLKHYSGWDTSVSVTSSQFGLTATAGLNEFFVIPHPTLTTEYYMVENRQQTGRDAGIPDAGLAIWHVDELGDNNDQEMTTELHYEVSLVQADGNFDLEGYINGGDSTDLWKSPGYTECTPATMPNTNWWSGAASGLAVLDVSTSGSTMTFDLALAAGTNVAPSASFTADPVSGFTPLDVQFTDTSIAGDTAITSRLWDFGDGQTSTEIAPSHRYNVAGSYTAALTVSNYLGTDQEFIATPIVVTDEPVIVLIDAIQEYDGASGLPTSPYDGQVVTIAGNIYVDAGTFSAGSHYVADTSGGISFDDAAAPVSLGDYIEVTGTVVVSEGEIQLAPLNYEGVTPGSVPSPLDRNPDEVVADYETVGSFVTVTGTVQNLASSSFELAGATSFVTVYVEGSTAIDLGNVSDGDTYQVSGPLAVVTGLIEIKPRWQADLVEIQGPVKLLITEVNAGLDGYPAVTMSDLAGEFIEIHNPNDTVVELENYYLTDAISYASSQQLYWQIAWAGPPTQPTVGGGNYNDFTARFPAGSTIAPGEILTISLPGSSWFQSVYGIQPDLELYEDDASPDAVPDMRPVFINPVEDLPGDSIFTADRAAGSDGLPRGIPELEEHYGEPVILYYWAEGDDLVTDIDFFVFGASQEGSYRVSFDKTGVSVGASTYLPDTAVLDQDWFLELDASGDSYCRADLLEGTQPSAGGNGVDGRDETGENLSATFWYSTPTPGIYSPKPTPVDDNAELPRSVRLGVNHPNPFNPVTTIPFELPRTVSVRMKVFDPRGHLVKTLIDAETMVAGRHEKVWNGRNDTGQVVASGVYLVMLEAGGITEMARMVMLK
jgi:M6 family metalloprotease-like protein